MVYSINNTALQTTTLPAFVSYITTNVDTNSDLKISYDEFKAFYDQKQDTSDSLERAVLEVLYTGLAAKVPDMTEEGSSSTFSCLLSFFLSFFFLFLLLIII